MITTCWRRWMRGSWRSWWTTSTICWYISTTIPGCLKSKKEIYKSSLRSDSQWRILDVMETIDDDCDNMDIVFVCVKVWSLWYKSIKHWLMNTIRTNPLLPSTILMSFPHWSFSRIRSPVFMMETWRSLGRFSPGSTICSPGLISNRSGGGCGSTIEIFSGFNFCQFL